MEIRERCRRLEKQTYWTEFEPNRQQFFKIMIAGFRNRLRIPKKFASLFKGQLSNTVRLRGPSGNAWNVTLARMFDDLIFYRGWEKFVEDHSLAEGDFLVFRYDGDSSFNVSIFDKTGCEQEGAYFVKEHMLCSKNDCFLEKRGKDRHILCSCCLLQMKQKEIAEVKDMETVVKEEQEIKPKDRCGDVGKKEGERNLKRRNGHETSEVVGNSGISIKNDEKGSVGARQVIILDSDVDESKGRSFSRKRRKCAEEVGSVKPMKVINTGPITTGKQKRSKIQNSVQVDVSNRFRSKEGSTEKCYWKGKGKILKKVKIVRTQKTHDVIEASGKETVLSPFTTGLS